jgi:cytoskeletal protein RodZ
MRNEVKSASGGKDNKGIGEKQTKEKMATTMMIVIIVVAVIITALIAVIVYLVFKNKTPNPTPSPSASASTSSTPAPSSSPEKRVGWETYNNSRFGFSVQVPPNLEKTESINGDGATFTTWNPPMTIRIWAINNDLNLTAQQAIDFDKQDYATNEAENLRVIVEGPIEMGGQGAVESIWQYSAPSTGDASTSARAYTIKGGTIYKIEFEIGTNFWNQYSTMFDDVFTSFKFL